MKARRGQQSIQQRNGVLAPEFKMPCNQPIDFIDFVLFNSMRPPKYFLKLPGVPNSAHRFLIGRLSAPAAQKR